jgi:hypothetical protein
MLSPLDWLVVPSEPVSQWAVEEEHQIVEVGGEVHPCGGELEPVAEQVVDGVEDVRIVNRLLDLAGVTAEEVLQVSDAVRLERERLALGERGAECADPAVLVRRGETGTCRVVEAFVVGEAAEDRSGVPGDGEVLVVAVRHDLAQSLVRRAPCRLDGSALADS